MHLSEYTASQLGVEGSLQLWCAETPKNSSEQSDRQKAATIIRECYYNHNNVLDLNGYRLTSLPDDGNRLIELAANGLT